MNVIDLLLSIVLLLGLVRGLFKGFFTELAGLLALIFGIYAAIHFSDLTYSFLETVISWEHNYLSILSFAVTFFVAALLVSLVGRMLTKMVSMMALGLVNRLLGGVFGLLKMAFLASLFFMFFDRFDIFNTAEETRENSVLYEPVREFAPFFLPKIIEEVKEGDIFETPEEEQQEIEI